MLTVDQAKALTEKIRVNQDTLDEDIIAAFQGHAHVVLGFKNWVDYATANFPKFKQAPADRLQSVLKMADAGMSNVSIGAALGVSDVTVLNDKRSATSNNLEVAGKPEKVAKSPKPASPKQSRKYIEAYVALAAQYPAWSVKEMTAYFVQTYPALTKYDATTKTHLKFGHQDVGRLRMWATAPVPFREAYYAEEITAAVGETILTSKPAKYLGDPDKLNLLHKVTTGLIGRGAPALRRVMEMLPSTRGQLRAEWMDHDRAMTFDELVRARTSADAEMGQSRAMAAERAAQIEAGIKLDYGIKAEKWIDQLNEEIDLVEQELPAIMALVFQAIPMANKLDLAGARLHELAQQIRNKGVKPEPTAAATHYTVVDADDNVTHIGPGGRTARNA